MSIDELIGALSEININHLVHAKQIIKATQGKLLILGNGGSSAIASHIAEDFTKNYKPALAFSDAPMLSCFANDFGWVEAYEVWLDKFVNPELDTVILISSSGESENVLNCARYCGVNNISLITLSGFKRTNQLYRFGSVAVHVNSEKYGVVEVVHLSFLHEILNELMEGTNDV